ncbi:M20/M25/M40 family metallo-hydrolase [Sinorhizobium medicae]|uniref:M20/M25/M40 family metallo-hydrolase n=1 Tax=Sinorhizobium medicae TaxID=110321 RepID=UPI0013E39E1F|nr:M20/M25/M40 family metallo-hydrolase [Sinorhizobium medicae]
MVAQDSTHWIVLGSDASASFATNLSILDNGSGRMSSGLTAIQTINGRTVAVLDPILEGLLQRAIHNAHHRCGGYTVHPTQGAAEAEAQNPFYEPGAVDRLGDFPRAIDQQAAVRPTLDRVDKEQIVATILKLQSFGTRYYQSESGQNAALELKGLWESYASNRPDFSVKLHTHGWRQNSVIASIRGTELSDEIVVIGGHLDSINTSNVDAAPGADDDASGVAAVTETLRVILASGFRPKRTLQFMAYAAEEVGLRGSNDIVQSYRDQGLRVIAALQLDMTGYAGSSEDMYFVTDYVSANLTTFLKDLIREYNGSGPHSISHGETACGYACSDHGSWTRYGVPSAFPFEARFEDYNQSIHSANDLLEQIDTTGERQAKFSKLGVEFMMELGKNSDPAP